MHRPLGSQSTFERIHRGIILTKEEKRLKVLSLKLVLPTALVILGSAGAATVFLHWMLFHQMPGQRVWQDKAFHLDEGTKLHGENEAARLFGLTISSAASKVVTITSPALVMLYSFHVARNWLHLGATSPEDQSLPTPLQYGLVVNLLSDGGLGSLLTAIRYFIRGPQRRAGTTSLLLHAFFMILLVFILSNAISLVDLWLHTSTATVNLPTTREISAPFKFSVDQTLCPPYPDPWWMAFQPCLMFPGGWGKGIESKVPGMLVRANNSDTLQTITLADSKDLAVLVKPNITHSLMFRAKTFGARASCQSVTPLCDNTFKCTGFPWTFPPYNGTFGVDHGTTEGGSKLFIQSSNCAWDAPYNETEPRSLACHHISSDRITSDASSFSELSPPPVNSYNLWMQFLWEADGDTELGIGAGKVSGAVTNFQNFATMLTNCTLNFYNVTLDYNNGKYFLVDEELSNVGLSDGLAAPTRIGHLASALISNIEGRAFGDNSTDSLMAFLEQDLSRLAIGSAAYITNVTSDTIMQSTLGTTVAGRYPFWPVFIFVILLYMHACLALFLFLQTALTMQTESLSLSPTEGYGGGNYRQVSMLELAQLRLRGPLPLIASLFPPQHPDVSAAALSIETSDLDMFRERPDDGRVRAGLYSDDSATNSQRFRVFRPENDSTKLD